MRVGQEEHEYQVRHSLSNETDEENPRTEFGVWFRTFQTSTAALSDVYQYMRQMFWDTAYLDHESRNVADNEHFCDYLRSYHAVSGSDPIAYKPPVDDIVEGQKRGRRRDRQKLHPNEKPFAIRVARNRDA